MTYRATFLNDQTQKPDIYIGRSDLGAYTLTITSDSSETVTDIRVQFPTTILTSSDVGKITVATASWKGTVQGNQLVLSGSQSITSQSSIVIKLTGVASSLSTQTNADLGVRVQGTNISPPYKIFLLKYPEAARNLQDDLQVKLLPLPFVYVTPDNNVVIKNQLVLQFTNLKPNEDLVTKPWVDTPTALLSFVYGTDIGSLTPADNVSNVYSAWNIKASVQATYQGHEWNATDPDPGSGGTDPLWTFKPIAANKSVLGSGAGATASFVIEDIATQNPVGTTVAYLQFSNFPGYNDGYFTLSLNKQEPQANILFFNGLPSNLHTLGEEVTLSWQCFDIQQVKLSYGNTTLDSAKGDISTGTTGVATHKVKVNSTTTFHLEAFKILHSTSPDRAAEVTVTVPEVSIESFQDVAHSASSSKDKVTLSWQMQGATSAILSTPGQADYHIPKADLNAGSHDVFIQAPTTYSLVAQGYKGPKTKSVSLFFLPQGWTNIKASVDFHALNRPLLYGTSDTLWLMNPGEDKGIYNSTDGHFWSQVGLFPESLTPRSGSDGVYWKDKFWVMGGTNATNWFHDVWSSSNGVSDWTAEATSAQWSIRSNFRCVVFQDKLWLMGGHDQNYQPLKDVWNSTDGKTWHKVGDANWTPRSDFGLAASSDTLYVFGGKTGPNSYSKELWSSKDGVHWTLAPQPNMDPRINPIVFTSGGAFYVFSGVSESGDPLMDFGVYQNTGWGMLPGIGWNVCNPGYTIFRGALWITGGTANCNSGSETANNVVSVLKLSASLE